MASMKLAHVRKKAAERAKRLREWFMGYDDAPLWLCFCRFIFAVSSLACILSLCGPAILVGDLIGFCAYQEWIQTDINFFYIYIVVVLVTFTLAVISGIPVFLYEKKKMEKSNELDPNQQHPNWELEKSNEGSGVRAPLVRILYHC